MSLLDMSVGDGSLKPADPLNRMKARCRMAKHGCIWILTVCWGMVSGCAAVVVATGAGAGAYTYVNGELARSYPTSYNQALEVCTRILDDLNMPIKEQSSDGVQTTIVSERKDGTPMTLKIRIIGLDVTEVSVRTGMVGYWNRDLSQQFQEFISQRLSP